MKNVIVTGGAGGIGMQLAIGFLQKGYRVCITDIDAIKLKKTQVEIEHLGYNVEVFCVDHSNSGENIKFINFFQEEFKRLDILCLNAGIGFGASFEQSSLQDFEKIMRVNFLANVDLLKICMPIMNAKEANLLITSSLAGLIGVPKLAAYSASKFALIGLAESIRDELEEKNIYTTVLCPGIINTPIIEHSEVKDVSKQAQTKLKEVYQNYGADPKDVAVAAIKALEQKKFLEVYPLSALLSYETKKNFPALFRFISGQLNRFMSR